MAALFMLIDTSVILVKISKQLWNSHVQNNVVPG